jgi:hypothetical protein
MVNEMRLSKIIVALMFLTLYAISFLPACAAFEDTVSVIEKKNISFDLMSEPDYNISTNVSMAMAVDAISINSTKPMGKNASIVLMSMNTGGDEIQMINQSEFSNFMESLFLASTRLTGGMETVDGMANSSLGKNVTLHKILMRATKNKPASESIIAFWDLDEYTHAILTSELDLNTTKRIVETLKLMP